MKLSGKIALVTGASGGLGAAIVERLAQEGADCVIGFLGDKAQSERIVDVVRASGRRGLSIEADIRNEQQVKSMFDTAAQSLGPPDIVVANAGYGGTPRPLLDTSLEEFEALINTNLIGTYLTVRHAAEQMKGRGAGKIITVSSIHGLGGAYHNSLYGTTKAGIINFTRGAAFDLAEYDIQVNCIAPGAVPVPNDPPPSEDSELHKAWMRYTPLGRYGSPSDIAGAAAFLASSDSDWLTGQVLSVDGGISAGRLIPSTKNICG